MGHDASDGEYRIERDSMGEVRVPAGALWGAQTQRAVANFPISGLAIHQRLIRALALVKAEAAMVNATLHHRNRRSIGTSHPRRCRAVGCW
jgi:fumarate hydratase, class II